jgi:hypothetical protein
MEEAACVAELDSSGIIVADDARSSAIVMPRHYASNHEQHNARSRVGRRAPDRQIWRASGDGVSAVETARRSR